MCGVSVTERVTPLQTRPLGAHGPVVSALTLGTMNFGEQVDAAHAHDLLDTALSGGINCFDTAESYASPMREATQGESERILGQWLQRVPRGEVVVASKVSGPAAKLRYLRGGPQLVRQQIREALDASLNRLGLDCLDLYQVHWPARSTNYFGRLGYAPRADEGATAILHTLEALSELQAEGRVRHLGVSNETPWGLMHYLALAERHGLTRITSLQNPYSLLNRVLEIGIGEVLHRESIGLMAYAPLCDGVLSGKYRHAAAPERGRVTRWPDYYTRYTTPAGVAATERYCALAEQLGLAPADMALAWVLSRPEVSTVVIGASDEAQLRQSLAAAACAVTADLRKAIGRLHAEHPNPCP